MVDIKQITETLSNVVIYGQILFFKNYSFFLDDKRYFLFYNFIGDDMEIMGKIKEIE